MRSYLSWIRPLKVCIILKALIKACAKNFRCLRLRPQETSLILITHTDWVKREKLASISLSDNKYNTDLRVSKSDTADKFWNRNEFFGLFNRLIADEDHCSQPSPRLSISSRTQHMSPLSPYSLQGTGDGRPVTPRSCWRRNRCPPNCQQVFGRSFNRSEKKCRRRSQCGHRLFSHSDET